MQSPEPQISLDGYNMLERYEIAYTACGLHTYGRFVEGYGLFVDRIGHGPATSPS